MKPNKSIALRQAFSRYYIRDMPCHTTRHLMLFFVLMSFFMSGMPGNALAEPGISGVGYQQAVCDSSSVPDVMEAGEKYPVSISFRNNGLVDWEEGREHYGLRLLSGEGCFIDPTFVLIPEGIVVSSGNSYNFSCVLQAPQETREVHLTFAVCVKSGASTSPIPVSFEKNCTIIPKNGISSPDLGSVRLITVPAGADVSLDGMHRGTTPLIIPDIRPGMYTLQVTHTGYTNRTVPVEVTAGSSTSVTLDLSDPHNQLVSVQEVHDDSIIYQVLEHVHLLLIVVLLVLTGVVVLYFSAGKRRSRSINRKGGSLSSGEMGSGSKTRPEKVFDSGIDRMNNSDTTAGSVLDNTQKESARQSGGLGRKGDEQNLKGTVTAYIPEKDKSNKGKDVSTDQTVKTDTDISDSISDQGVYLGFPHELRDRYEPLAIIGNDPYTRIYQVRRKVDDKIRAVKLPQNTAPPSEILQKEISVWHTLKNPHILPVYRFEYEPVMYLEMEYLDGVRVGDSAIHSFAEFKKPISPELAVKLIRGVAQGIAYLHSLGVRHYHLHQGNILLNGSRDPVISGLARGKNEFGFAVGDSDPAHADASYLAPEQRYPEKYGTVGMKTDIYQTGVILYELLTGVSPYSKQALKIAGRDASENSDENLVLPSEINSSLVRFDSMITRMVSWDKKKRYGTIRNFLEDLDSLEDR